MEINSIDTAKKRFRLRIIIPAFPAFNIYSYSARQTTALGPVCVATAVNKMEKWDVEVIDENNLRRHGPLGKTTGADHEILQSLRPADAAGFYGGLTSTVPRLYEVAKFYKKLGIITIAGGQHFAGDNIHEALSSGIDYVVRGEGEETITELLEALQGQRDLKDVRSIAYLKDGEIVTTPQRPAITDFDSLPIPNFSLVRYAKLNVYPVERIRGCGMECEFCTVKGKPRPASPERLLERISFIVETRGARKFFIVDDLFGQDRKETIRFCNMLRDYQKKLGIRLDLGVQIRLDKSRDAELLTAMREACINLVAIGFESPIEDELATMHKNLKPEHMLEMTKIYRKNGFLVHGMFIFGYPLKENRGFRMPADERVKQFRKFIKKAKLDTIQALLPVPLPGTELRERLKKQNRLYPLEHLGWEYYDGNFPLFEPDQPMTAEEMHRSMGKIMGKFYRFRHMFMIGLSVCAFPSIVFFLHNIQAGWRRWYRPWRSHLIRFGGWITMKQWMSAFNKDAYYKNLREAEESLRRTRLRDTVGQARQQTYS